MTIDYSGINVNFPVAGQDNDSQTFRDNYAAIYSAFAQTDGVLTVLNTSTARLNTTNEFQGNTIQHASLQNVVQEYNGPVDATNQNPMLLQFNAASFQEFENVTTTTFKVSGWPNSTDWASSSYYAQVRIKVNPDASVGVYNGGAWGNCSVTFDSNITGGTVHRDSAQTLPYVTTSTNSQIWDVWTTNGGSDIYVKFVGSYN
jgi:hypothetical protein